MGNFKLRKTILPMKLRNIICAVTALFFLITSSSFAQKLKGKDQLITISTPQGDIKLVLFDDTPKHKENFLKLTKEGFFDGTTFHRVIDGFMIQGGDPNSKDDNPNNDGSGSPGYT